MKNIYYICTCVLALMTGCSEYPDPHSVAPEASTGEVTDIYRFGATISGSFTDAQKDAGPVERCGVLLSLYDSMAEADTLKTNLLASGQTFVIHARNLKAGTEYFYQTFVGSGISLVTGERKTFKTNEQNVPIFDDNQLLEKDCKSAIIASPIIDEGGSAVINRGFCYKLASNSTDLPDADKDKKDFELMESEDLKGRIPNLIPDKEYVIRPYAINQTGIGYGEAVRIRTDATTVPVMSSVTVQDKSISQIVLSAYLLSPGQETPHEMGFCWSTTPNPSIEGLHQAIVGDGSSITAPLTGMRPNVLYYVCAYATSSRGTGYGDSYGFVLEAKSKPVLSVITANDISTSSVNVLATILGDGGDEILEKGFCYSDLTMPSVGDENTKVVTLATDGLNLKTLLKDLSPATTYAIRAYARNSKGIGYSQSLCIKTRDSVHPEGGANDWDDEVTVEGGLN